MKRAMTLLLVAAALAPVAAAPTLPPLPSDSVYQSNAHFTDAQSRRFAWSTMRGQPQLVSMFYTSCKFVCPMIVDSGKAIEQSLSTGERARLGVTLITLDPTRDTPAVLARMRLQRDLDSARWTLAAPIRRTCGRSPDCWGSAIGHWPMANSTTRPFWCCSMQTVALSRAPSA
jgi:protein SCO1/2